MIVNTRIRLSYGNIIDLASLKRSRRGYRLLSVNPKDSSIVQAFTYGAVAIGQRKTVSITLDSFEHIVCTPEQIFFTQEGEPIQAKDIKPGMNLLSACMSIAVTVADIETGREAEVFALPIFEGENFVLCSGGLATKTE